MAVDIKVRWADNTPELVKNLKQGTGEIEATRASVEKLAQSLGGDKLIASAHRMVAAIGEIGGAEKLTNAERDRTNALLDKALQKYTALGKTAPQAMVDVFEATKKASDATTGWGAAIEHLGGSWVATIASGQLLSQAITGLVSEFKTLALAIPEIALQGAAFADVEENFKRLTTQAGRLGNTLLGELKTGTHNTITDFNLMKLANQDLAAGMNLTDQQFGTLAKGAFALAQATGTDVKTGLETMNDAMLTGRTRALALLTGKIDLVKAEEDYAKSLGSTVEHLTSEGKIEAAREAILKAVGAATERLGEQTDGLDERVAQATAAWDNFKISLGKAVATSEVLAAGMDSLKDAIQDAFGSSQDELIKAIARNIDDAAIALVSFAKAAVYAGGFIVTEFYAVEKVFGDVIQIAELGALGIERMSLSVAEFLQKATFGEASKKYGEDVTRITANIKSLTEAIKARGEALQEADRNQAAVGGTTDKFIAALDTVQGKMIAARDAAASYVAPLEATAKAQNTAADAAGKHAGMLQASKEELAKAKKAQEDYAKAVERYNSTDGPSYLSILDKIGNQMYEGIAFDKARGKSTEDLVLIYKTSSTVIDQVVKSEKDAVEQHKILEKVLAAESTALNANIQEWNNLGTAVKGQQAAFDAFGKLYERLEDDIKKSTLTTTDYQIYQIEKWRDKELAALNRSIDGWQIHEQRIKETAQKEIADIQYAQESIIAMLARISAEADRAKPGKTFVQAFGESLEELPDIIQRAFEGGGGIDGALAASVASLAHRLFGKGGVWQMAVTSESSKSAQYIAEGMQIGASILGGVTANPQSKTSQVLNTAATGAKYGSVVPGIGTAIGFGVGAAVGALKVSPVELNARKAFEDYQKQFGTLNDMIAKVGAAYAAMGKDGTEAQRDLQRALDATHGSAEDVARALKVINDNLTESQKYTKGVSDAVNQLVDVGKLFGGTVPDAFKDAINQISQMKGITDEEKAALLAMTKDVKPNFEQLTATAAKYGVTLEGLGKSFQQANIEGRAKQISGDFDALTKAGGDAGGILSGMSDEISQLVNDSKKFGTAIPENMRVLISELVRSGQLLDENGNKIEDMSGISFEDTPIDESIASLTDAIKDLIAALTGVPRAADEISKIKIPPVKIPVVWDTSSGSGLPPGAQTFLAGDQVSIPSFATGSGGFQDFGVGTIAMLHGHEAVVTEAQASTVTNSTSSQSTTVVVPVVIPVGASQSDVVDRVMAALPENVRRNSKGLRSAMLGGMGLPVTTWTQSR